MTRRQFGTALAALGLGAAASPGQGSPEVETRQLARNGWVPNNERLPVLHYHRGFDPAAPTLVDAMERTLLRNRWPAQWRNGVYPFHHYHSTAHEVLGFAAGAATLILGGEGGALVRVEAGDVLVLPTGTGHCLQQASRDFLVVGAYPAGQHWDICRAAPDAAAVERMHTLPFPSSDPVRGANGPLVTAWNRS